MTEPKKEPPPEAPPAVEPPVPEDEGPPPGLVADAPELLEDEAALLARARARQRRENPELHRLTQALGARLKKK